MYKLSLCLEELASQKPISKIQVQCPDPDVHPSKLAQVHPLDEYLLSYVAPLTITWAGKSAGALQGKRNNTTYIIGHSCHYLVLVLSLPLFFPLLSLSIPLHFPYTFTYPPFPCLFNLFFSISFYLSFPVVSLPYFSLPLLHFASPFISSNHP